jgi:hypothetical protein
MAAKAMPTINPKAQPNWLQCKGMPVCHKWCINPETGTKFTPTGERERGGFCEDHGPVFIERRAQAAAARDAAKVAAVDRAKLATELLGVTEECGCPHCVSKLEIARDGRG